MLTIPADLKSRPRRALWAWYEEAVRTPGRSLDEKEAAYDAVCAALPKPVRAAGAMDCGHSHGSECDLDCRI